MIFSKHFLSSFIRYSRNIHTSQSQNAKVAVLGANGGIGQFLSLLLKRSPNVKELSLYDIQSVKGLAADLSHIPKPARVIATQSTPDGLVECIKHSDIIVIVAGKPRNPGMTRADLFTTNASIVSSLAHQCALVNPKSMLCIVTNPINSMVPLAAHIFKSLSVYDPCRLFGVTTLDSVRANTFVAQAKGLMANELYVPVIGGHSETTLIPVISQCVPSVSFPPTERLAITRRIQTAGTALVEAKAGQGSATLCMAYSAFKFVSALIDSMEGTKGIVQCAFVESPGGPCEFFATPLVLGRNGIQRNIGIGPLTDFELSLLTAAIPELQEGIRIGKEFAKNYLSSLTKHS